MFKKNIKFYIIMAIVFLFKFDLIIAEEESDLAIKSKVQDMISEIYQKKEQYEDLVGNYEEDLLTTYNATSDKYWWPIGSIETTKVDGKIFANGDPENTIITSEFGYRNAVYGSDGVQISGDSGHGALDIANSTGVGVTNVIASKSGIVVYPAAGDPTNCPVSYSGSSCGGGYGNYVIIQHADGNYTLYGHLHENTITVTSGDSVEQGQVIAKMGSSGNSNGSHLHFEIRKGQNSFSSAVDPLEYVSMEDPRPIGQGSSRLVEWLDGIEGHTPIVGDSYMVVDIGDNVRSVGNGVTLEYNPEKFAKYGINIADYPIGSTIPISIVNQIKMDIIQDKYDHVYSVLSENSITLESHQIDALVSQCYNPGNIVGFVSAYEKYGNTIGLFNNWMFRAYMPGTKFEAGLKKRRRLEWKMFHEGIYSISE